MARGSREIAGLAPNELCLTTGSVERRDRKACCVSGARLPVVAAHEMQAHIEPGGCAGGSHDAALVHEQDVRIDMNFGKASCELRSPNPVSRSSAAIEQPRRREHKRSLAEELDARLRRGRALRIAASTCFETGTETSSIPGITTVSAGGKLFQAPRRAQPECSRASLRLLGTDAYAVRRLSRAVRAVRTPRKDFRGRKARTPRRRERRRYA